MNKLITILGPTASGKSTLGIELAKEFDGEIVSADSRQVYRGLDIGTGKVTLEEQKLVPHHLLDVVEPMGNFSLAHYQKLAFAAIDGIIKRGQPASSAGRLPFLVGGTALYIYAVVDNYNLSNVGPNAKQRQELERLSTTELQAILSHHTHPPILTSSDYQNPRRLIRAIEKLEAGAPLRAEKNPARYNSLLLGIDIPREKLYKKIDQRVDERIKQGMIEEVKRLRQSVADDKLLGFGLEYRFITEYLLGRWLSQEAMLARLKTASHAFVRRQLTWWRKDKRIVWIRNLDQAKPKITDFLK
ncbi:MAG: tRNA (adenosine(37)-N6)-dimethylallyltransferase MiaA [Candidatus Komeilibacteria bacterium RIFCSPLOWO2_02_FULL_48_11]|uniref:tRNA dimethylallyltransferase n=1 Tax=Candidatus Komeilibacteria bacterium RIFCSPLOWO2_02_FULL_48_11 TaxID=1798553 RepID=A0A1G2BR50_9BACT|nr:MAG: tRNA (adenosine(37)-N6)-dimethylallyltransferase MiaA [Candidatus Komeilibacteria bacterium RIFCSPLOWO2_02_FULL_48_11]